MSGVLLLLAVALAVAPRPALATARLRGLGPPARRADVAEHFRWLRSRRPAGRSSPVLLGAVAGGVGFAVMASAVSADGLLLPVLAGCVAGATVGRVTATALRRRSRDRAAAAQAEAVAALAAEVRAGQRPDAALAAAGLQPPPAELRAVWALSELSGAPVATVLDRVEDDVRARTRRRQSVATQLAGARSTAVLLAGLPLLGMALGAAMGARPLPVLFGTAGGQLALLAGVVLDSAGVLWTARIVSAADGDR